MDIINYCTNEEARTCSSTRGLQNSSLLIHNLSFLMHNISFFNTRFIIFDALADVLVGRDPVFHPLIRADVECSAEDVREGECAAAGCREDVAGVGDEEVWEVWPRHARRGDVLVARAVEAPFFGVPDELCGRSGPVGVVPRAEQVVLEALGVVRVTGVKAGSALDDVKVKGVCEMVQRQQKRWRAVGRLQGPMSAHSLSVTARTVRDVPVARAGGRGSSLRETAMAKHAQIELQVQLWWGYLCTCVLSSARPAPW